MRAKSRAPAGWSRLHRGTDRSKGFRARSGTSAILCSTTARRLASAIGGSRLDCAPLTDPQVTWEPGKLENARSHGSSESFVPAMSPRSVPPPVPHRPSPFLRACPRASPPVAPPARRSGRKEHHCARYTLGARAFIPVALAGAVLFSLAPSTPAAAATITTEGQQIVRIARCADRGSLALRRTGALRLRLLRARALRIQAGGRQLGHQDGCPAQRAIDLPVLQARTARPAGRTRQIGDLVVWGHGSHIGIYIGDGKAISTLRNGVRVHGVFAVTARFTTYIHTGMSTRPVS